MYDMLGYAMRLYVVYVRDVCMCVMDVIYGMIRHVMLCVYVWTCMYVRMICMLRMVCHACMIRCVML